MSYLCSVNQTIKCPDNENINNINIVLINQTLRVMSKKGKIILGSVVAVCCFGCFSSLFIDWPVDFSDASGDIAKATRFSREQASEKLTNM